MNLVKGDDDPKGSHGDQVHVAPSVQRRMGLVTRELVMAPLDAGAELQGQVVVDEGKVISVTPKVDGWVRQVGVSGAGQAIKRGQFLYAIYSPDLQQRQRDYIDLLTRRDALLGQSAGMNGVGNSAPEAMLASVARERFKARQRLLAADVPEDVIDAIDKDRRVRDIVPVRAEHDGQLVLLQAREGSYVAPSQPVVTYNRADAAQLELGLSAEQLSALPARFELEVKPVGGGAMGLKVSALKSSALIDPQSRLAKLRVALPSTAAARSSFLPGSLVRAELKTSGRPVLSVPKDAVVRGGGADYVVIAEADDHFRRVKVELGVEGRDAVEVRAGLKAGATLVVNGQFLIGTEASWQVDRQRQDREPAHHAH